VQNTIAVLPLPGASLRDAGVRTRDFVVIGNGRAVIIEVDGPHHFGATRKADDHTRDRHWDRCGVRTIRIPSEHADDPASLKDLLREDLRRGSGCPDQGEPARISPAGARDAAGAYQGPYSARISRRKEACSYSAVSTPP
jgi:hypothetical protein